MCEAYINSCIQDCLKQAAVKSGGSEWFEAYRQKHGICSVRKLDREIFFRMYGREPDAHELQKVRFWRLRQHLPKNREEGILLGSALELTGDALDRFLEEELGSQRLSPVEGREQVMKALLLQYLCRVSGERLEQLNIRPGTQRRHIRHIFYTDALDCLAVHQAFREHCRREHLYSRNFAAEFQKYQRPDTVISRENMLRLLILLLMPDLDQRALDEWLSRMGYAPLRPDRAVNGFVDLAVLRILELCAGERSCGMEADKERMKEILSRYDRMVKERMTAAAKEKSAETKWLAKLRFMKFRSMDENAAVWERGRKCRQKNIGNG